MVGSFHSQPGCCPLPGALLPLLPSQAGLEDRFPSPAPGVQPHSLVPGRMSDMSMRGPVFWIRAG